VGRGSDWRRRSRAAMSAVRGADLDQFAAGRLHDVRHAEGAADLDQLAARDQGLPASHPRLQRKQDGGSIVVDYGSRLARRLSSPAARRRRRRDRRARRLRRSYSSATKPRMAARRQLPPLHRTTKLVRGLVWITVPVRLNTARSARRASSRTRASIAANRVPPPRGGGGGGVSRSLALRRRERARLPARHYCQGGGEVRRPTFSAQQSFPARRNLVLRRTFDQRLTNCASSGASPASPSTDQSKEAERARQSLASRLPRPHRQSKFAMVLTVCARMQQEVGPERRNPCSSTSRSSASVPRSSGHRLHQRILFPDTGSSGKSCIHGRLLRAPRHPRSLRPSCFDGSGNARPLSSSHELHFTRTMFHSVLHSAQTRYRRLAAAPPRRHHARHRAGAHHGQMVATSQLVTSQPKVPRARRVKYTCQSGRQPAHQRRILVQRVARQHAPASASRQRGRKAAARPASLSIRHWPEWRN